MITFPNAKINLGLNVIEKRSDGFHNIESVFYPIPLYDALEIMLGNKTDEFTISGTKIEGDLNDNLILKTLNAVRKNYEVPILKIHLLKNIPTGAGLGGGSSDAAFFLNQLNEVFALNISVEERKNIVTQLGSDCAFFIENKPAFATKKGDALNEINVSLKNYLLVLIKPDIYVSTPSAYKSIKPLQQQIKISEIIKLPVHKWKEHLINDFEKPVFEMHPEIKKIKEKLYKEGALYASMSGSGSSVYGIFEGKKDLKNKFENCFYHAHFL